MECNFKRVASFEITAEVALAIEMHEQPAIPLFGDEDGIPGLLATHVEHLVTDKTMAQTSSYSLFKPLVDKVIVVIQVHYVDTIVGIAEEYRVGAFPKAVCSFTQGYDGRFDCDLDFIMLRVFCRCCYVLKQEFFPRKPCQ